MNFAFVNIFYLKNASLISDTIDNVAPIKEIRLKDSKKEWFDNEIADAIKLEINIS